MKSSLPSRQPDLSIERVTGAAGRRVHESTGRLHARVGTDPGAYGQQEVVVGGSDRTRQDRLRGPSEVG